MLFHLLQSMVEVWVTSMRTLEQHGLAVDARVPVILLIVDHLPTGTLELHLVHGVYQMPADLLLCLEFLFASRAFGVLLFPFVDARSAENSLALLAQLHGLSYE